MPDIEIDGNRIHYLEFGDAGAPPIFVVHGLMGDAVSVQPLAEQLAATGLHVYAHDAIGHGLSSHPAAFTLEDQGQTLDHLIAALGYDRAAVLGVSMGSYVAAQAAILEPSRVSKLVLVVPKAHGKTSSTAAYAKRNGIDLTKATQDELVQLLAAAMWAPTTSEERRQEAVSSVQPEVELTPAERVAIEKSLAGFDLRPRLAEITAPTLVISGKHDGLNPPEAGEEVAAGIPGSRFEVYDRSGHMLTVEESERLVDEVAAFLAE